MVCESENTGPIYNFQLLLSLSFYDRTILQTYIGRDIFNKDYLCKY